MVDLFDKRFSNLAVFFFIFRFSEVHSLPIQHEEIENDVLSTITNSINTKINAGSLKHVETRKHAKILKREEI